MQTTNDLATQVENNMQALRTLRDEIRVRAHLFNMELKQAWAGLEPRIVQAEKAAKQVNDASHKAIDEALRAVKQFRSQLKDK